MRTSKIISVIILILIVSVACIAGCGSSNGKSIVGQWYNENGKCLDIRSDGTWKLEDSYGTGTYKLLDDKETFEFTDYYGDTQESKINEDELGIYVDFSYYGYFYKDAYPSEEKIAEVNAKNAISLNPFDGIKYEVSGISPYCKVSVNNQGCAEDVQKYVTYELDKDCYANGETAVITAILDSYTGDNTYLLSSDNAKYKISGQDEYVTSVEDIDMDVLKKEVNDTINAMISASMGTEKLFGQGVSDSLQNTVEWKAYADNIYSTRDVSITDVTNTIDSVYFSQLKKQKEGQFGYNMPYNTVSFLCTFDFSADYNVNLRGGGNEDLHLSNKMYIIISATNVIKHANGDITWNDEKCDFSWVTSFDGSSNLISNTVMSKTDNYNVSETEAQ